MAPSRRLQSVLLRLSCLANLSLTVFATADSRLGTPGPALPRPSKVRRVSVHSTPWQNGVIWTPGYPWTLSGKFMAVSTDSGDQAGWMQEVGVGR
jgi:hypothetical protein